MKKVTIIYDKKSHQYPWVLKNLRADNNLACFNSRLDALNWYLSFEIPSLIEIYNSSDAKIAQITFFGPKNAKNEANITLKVCPESDLKKYEKLCKDYLIDPDLLNRDFAKNTIKQSLKEMNYIILNDPYKYFSPEWEIKNKTIEKSIDHKSRDARIFKIISEILKSNIAINKASLKEMKEKYLNNEVSYLELYKAVKNTEEIDEYEKNLNNENTDYIKVEKYKIPDLKLDEIKLEEIPELKEFQNQVYELNTNENTKETTKEYFGYTPEYLVHKTHKKKANIILSSAISVLILVVVAMVLFLLWYFLK
ncbi:MAG3090 family protein [Mycoplasmopsis felifaucium]|uniref:MAG3090 family protein n=1 Tax=Mycoplasmopsis felifaucium TaxID=35768 RepID=UPI000481944F|nr:hypothetical protein [Mycoplasmopsis felifaucium]